MSKLEPQQRLDLQELLDMSSVTIHSPAASPRPQSPAPSTAAKSCASVSDGVTAPFDDNTSDTAEQMLLNKGMPAMFLTVEGDAKPDIENATKKNSSADALDQRHAGSSATPAARPPGAVQLGPPDYGFSTQAAVRSRDGDGTAPRNNNNNKNNNNDNNNNSNNNSSNNNNSNKHNNSNNDNKNHNHNRRTSPL